MRALRSQYLFLLFNLLLAFAVAQRRTSTSETLPTLGGNDETTSATKATNTKAAATTTADDKTTTDTGDGETSQTKTIEVSTQSVSAPPKQGITSAVTTTDSSGRVVTSNVAVPSMPKLPKLIPEYPPPTVPPTANAPFMQQSTVPEGTVFIAVGAALGFLGLSVVAWRGLVAWSLHRSVRKANAAAVMGDKKNGLQPPGTSGRGGNAFYAAGAGSSLSLDHLTARKGKTEPFTSHTPNSSLFFSPTAGAGASMGTAPGARGSTYLPAGYYATGGNQGSTSSRNLAGAAPNASQTHFHTNSLSTTSRYASGGYAPPGVGPSPPASPLMSPAVDPRSAGLPPSRSGQSMTGGYHGLSTGSQSNLALPPTGRAPSAYLEDLFDNGQLNYSQDPGRQVGGGYSNVPTNGGQHYQYGAASQSNQGSYSSRYA